MFDVIVLVFITRILYPEIQPKLASLLKKGYKVGRSKHNI